MTWPDFERLLLRVVREVRGLRNVRLFGVPGQQQDGIDVVGVNADGEVEAVQGKRYQKFGVADLDRAVKKFREGSVPFAVRRLAVAASCEAHDRSVTERLITYNTGDSKTEIELWDRSRLSEMLRARPDIVTEFFGAVTAARFCVPHTVGPVEVPPPDAVTLADAVMAGPVETSGAKAALDLAEAVRVSDPAGALEHVRRAQELLVSAGFPVHAQVLDKRAVELLRELGRIEDAARLLLDRLWASLDADRTSDAEGVVRDLEGLLEGSAPDEQEDGESHQNRVNDADPFAQAAVQLARQAVELAVYPLTRLPPVSALAAGPSVADRGRLLLLAAEIALADGEEAWLSGAGSLLRELAEAVQPDDEGLGVRLKLVAADATGEWGDLLASARTRKIARPLASLVLARYARYLALRGGRVDADAEWGEAIEQACLSGLHNDAANWLYSRRALAMRYSISDDVWYPLASALDARPLRARIAAAPSPVRERALDAMQRNKPREAVLRLRRLLRDEVVSAAWQGESNARALLAAAYGAAGELDAAIRHLINAAEVEGAKDLASRAGDIYLDARQYLSAETYWTRATAFQVIAVQDDVVPDEHVQEIAEHAFSVLDAANAGRLVDTPFFAPSVYVAAHEALAALSDRLSRDAAARLLEYLAPRAFSAEGHFVTDDAHARACARIAAASSDLRETSLQQLLGLLKRVPESVRGEARTVLVRHADLIETDLRALAGENRYAAELVAQIWPDQIDGEVAEEAAASLMAPLSSGKGHYAAGGGSVGQSILARGLPAQRRADLVAEQLRRARLPHEMSGNRVDYLLAAANLASDLPEDRTDELFALALAEATDPAPSAADALMASLSHPLGAMQVQLERDSRPAAALLTACLARSPEQREKARAAALHLIGADGEADYYVTRALQQVQGELARDVPFLAKQGWALRSLAAIAWANDESTDAAIGTALATDRDVRVRRALADALAEVPPSDRTGPARAALAADPRYSVRRLLQGTHSVGD